MTMSGLLSTLDTVATVAPAAFATSFTVILKIFPFKKIVVCSAEKLRMCLRNSEAFKQVYFITLY